MKHDGWLSRFLRWLTSPSESSSGEDLASARGGAGESSPAAEQAPGMRERRTRNAVQIAGEREGDSSRGCSTAYSHTFLTTKWLRPFALFENSTNTDFRPHEPRSDDSSTHHPALQRFRPARNAPGAELSWVEMRRLEAPMKHDGWLSRSLRWLRRFGTSIAERFRPLEETGTGIAGQCLTCCGTGKWYEGTPREEPCVNCGGRGWGLVEPGGEAEPSTTGTEHEDTSCPGATGPV